MSKPNPLPSDNDEPLTFSSLSSKLKQCAMEVDNGTPSSKTISTLTELQTEVSRLQIFSSNETLRDLNTNYLPLLNTEFYLAKSFVSVSTTNSLNRYGNLNKAVDLFFAYLRNLESKNDGDGDDEGDTDVLLQKNVEKEYHTLMDMSEQDEEEDTQRKPILGESRDSKIARFRLKSEIKKKLEYYTGEFSNSNEDDDDDDKEYIARKLYLTNIQLNSIGAIDEIYGCFRELEMLKIAVEFEKRRQIQEKYMLGDSTSTAAASSSSNNVVSRTGEKKNHKPLEVTRVTCDPISNQLIFKKEQIQKQVFRPGWNQPTMSLDELARMEVEGAKARAESQRIAEQVSLLKPKRYDQLVRDGLEDNADLVDQSAKLDREWDDFKEANPRGCGNKMSERGDRNF